jgi:chromosome segregation ATPase
MKKVKVKVIVESFGEYKKDDTLEMEESTAKACVKNEKVEIVGEVKKEDDTSDDANVKELKSQLATANEELGKAKTQIEDLQTQLSGKETELATANEELGKVKASLTEAQGKLKISEAALKKANTEVAKLKK